MAASRRGSSHWSNVRKSAGKAAQAAWLAPNTASPQVTGRVCTWVVMEGRPRMLPDMVPVMAHSVLLAVRLGTICEKLVSTGTPPKAPTKSAWLADDTRTRRPVSSDKVRSGFLQNTTCAGYT